MISFHNSFRSTMFAVLLLAATGSVFAQSLPAEEGFYLGAVGGVSAYPSRPVVIVGSSTLQSTGTREDDFAWALNGGYRFGKHFAVEAGYVDLGEGTANMIDSAGSALEADLHFSARGKTLAAVLLFPTWKWETFVKAGLMFQDVQFRLNGTQNGAPFALSSSTDDGVRGYVEGGVSYRFNEKWKASLGLSLYPEVGKEDETGQADVRYSFLGVTYDF